MDCLSLLCNKGAYAHRYFSTCSPCWIFISVLTRPWITLRSTNSELDGISCSCSYSRERTRQAHRPGEARNRTADHRTRDRKRTTRVATGTSQRRMPSTDASVHAPQHNTRWRLSGGNQKHLITVEYRRSNGRKEAPSKEDEKRERSVGRNDRLCMKGVGSN